MAGLAGVGALPSGPLKAPQKGATGLALMPVAEVVKARQEAGLHYQDITVSEEQLVDARLKLARALAANRSLHHTAVAQKQQLAVLEAEIAQKEGRLATRSLEASCLDARLAVARAELEEKQLEQNTEMLSLSKSIMILDERIAETSEITEALQVKNRDDRQCLADQEHKIAEYQREIESLQCQQQILLGVQSDVDPMATLFGSPGEASPGLPEETWTRPAVIDDDRAETRLGHSLAFQPGMDVDALMHLPGCDLSQLLPADVVSTLRASAETAEPSVAKAKAAPAKGRKPRAGRKGATPEK